MQTTFRNTEKQHLRRKEVDRHLHVIRTAGFIPEDEFSENADVTGFVDDVAGQPLSKSIPASDSSVSTHRRRLPRGRTAALVVAILVVITVLCLLLPQSMRSDDISSNDKIRYRHLFSLVLDFGVTNREDLERANSPQAQALRWLAYEDSSDDVEDLRTRFSLATLFFSTRTNATLWKREDFWLTESSICQWYGVTCLKTHAKLHLVHALNLSMNGLDGTLPEEIALLQGDCQVLDLSHNSIRGPIPTMIGKQMKNLKQLYLGPNPLASTIPESLYELSSLTHLYLDSSQLHGTISKDIGKLKSLHGLGLHENQITGTLPITLGSLTGLRVLNLDENMIEGSIPSSLGSLTGLVDLRLDQNELTGFVPKTLSSLVILEILYLDNNNLEGRFPNVVAESMPFLTEVQLHNNGFTGTVPSGFAYAPFLRVLYVDGNDFMGEMPDAICERVVGGSLEALWADCGDPIKVACDIADCCTRCLPEKSDP